jgi:hypothetical protein
LISEGGHPVAGVTVKTAGTTCILGEEGILASLESAGFGAGLQTALKCAGIEFAQSLGLTRLVMGRSLARLSDPVLQHKLRWDPVIQPAGRSLHPEWTFTAAHDDGPAIDHLNRIGLLSFLRGKPCLVSVGAVGGDRQAMARKVGRALVVEAGRAGRLEEVAP